MSVILCNMLAHWLNWLFYDIATLFFSSFLIVFVNSLRWLLAALLEWCICWLLFSGWSVTMSEELDCSPITGYCSNTTSCTENHCALKSNKVCHCYRGKLFFFFFSFFFPSAYPNFSWHAATVNCENEVHCYGLVSHRQHMKNTTREMCLRQLNDSCFVLDLDYMERHGSVLSPEMHKEWNQRCPRKVIN